MVAGAICGALGILFVGTDTWGLISRFMGTLFILSGAALVSFIDFNKIESRISSVQVFATLGVFMNILWMFLWIGALWGVFDIWSYDHCAHAGHYCARIGFSPLGMITMISTYLSSLGLLGSITLAIYEGEKKSTIRPLKLTAISCLVYTELHAIFDLLAMQSETVVDPFLNRLDILAVFTGFVWFITTLVAYILAKHEKDVVENKERKEREDAQQKILEQAASNIAASKTEDELRAEIEEKVRREMIEKEVRAKLEKEMTEKKSNE